MGLLLAVLGLQCAALLWSGWLLWLPWQAPGPGGARSSTVSQPRVPFRRLRGRTRRILRRSPRRWIPRRSDGWRLPRWGRFQRRLRRTPVKPVVGPRSSGNGRRNDANAGTRRIEMKTNGPCARWFFLFWFFCCGAPRYFEKEWVAVGTNTNHVGTDASSVRRSAAPQLLLASLGDAPQEHLRWLINCHPECSEAHAERSQGPAVRSLDAAHPRFDTNVGFCLDSYQGAPSGVPQYLASRASRR